MMKTQLLAGLMAAMFATAAEAQAPAHRYVTGIRSGLITGTMRLSELDAAFDDLAPGGPAGPHMSGLFLMYRARPHLRIGIETLVASSDAKERTTMNYQAAGLVVEGTAGTTWFVSAGVHGGGLIVNVMARQGVARAAGADAGAFIKADGAFVAPYLDVGRRFRRFELGAYAKRVTVLGEKARGGLTEFGSAFAGVRLGVGL
jgi:hypothetical protein